MATSTRIMAFKAKRKLLRAVGTIGFWGGAVFLLLDMTTPFPTPVQGGYATWWLLVVAAGAVFWVLSRKLPNLELIDLADVYNGELSIPTVMQELSLPLSMATAALEGMADDDLAGEIHVGKQRIWVFYGIDDDNRLLVKTIQEAPAHGGEFTVQGGQFLPLDQRPFARHTRTNAAIYFSASTSNSELSTHTAQ